MRVASWRRAARCMLHARGWRLAVFPPPKRHVWTSTVRRPRNAEQAWLEQRSHGFRFRHQPHTTAVTHASPAAQLYLSAAMRSRAMQDRRRRTPAFALSRCMHQPPPALPNASPSRGLISQIKLMRHAQLHPPARGQRRHCRGSVIWLPSTGPAARAPGRSSGVCRRQAQPLTRTCPLHAVVC